MRIWAAAGLVVLLSAVSAWASDVQSAYGAVSALLQKDGGGLVARQTQCPRKNDDPWWYAASATVASIDEHASAVLIDALDCGGGNGHGQFLVLVEGDAARVLTNLGIGDMDFIASAMRVDDDSLVLYGDHWLDSDPHCCPSKKASLEYNLKTHQHKLTIIGNNQP